MPSLSEAAREIATLSEKLAEQADIIKFLEGANEMLTVQRDEAYDDADHAESSLAEERW